MIHISVHITSILLLTKRNNVDAKLVSSENVIAGNGPSSEMLTSQSQKP